MDVQYAHKLFAVVLWVVFASNLALGAELFVGQVCDKQAPLGTRENPFSDIPLAYNAAQPGDTIVALPNDLGMPYGRTTVLKDNLWFRAESGPLETCCGGFDIGQDLRARITGLSITSSIGSGVDIGGGDKEVTIECCFIYACKESGVHVEETTGQGQPRLLVQNCVIHGNSEDGVFLELFRRFDTFPPRTTVQSSAITGNGRWGVNPAFIDQRADCPNRGGLIEVRFSYVAANNAPVVNGIPLANGNGDIRCINTAMPCNPVPPLLVTACDLLIQPPDFVDPNVGDFRIRNYAHNGIPGKDYLNPDGTRNTVGAFGGPCSVGFYEPAASGGPMVQKVVIQSVAGGKVQVCVTVK